MSELSVRRPTRVLPDMSRLYVSMEVNEIVGEDGYVQEMKELTIDSNDNKCSFVCLLPLIVIVDHPDKQKSTLLTFMTRNKI